jgi:hypothetical protein
METTIEIIVYFTIIFIVATVVVSFIITMNIRKEAENVKEGLLGIEDNVSLVPLTSYEFVDEIYEFWMDCDKGRINMSKLFYVNKGDNVSKEWIFNISKELNWCDTLQSGEFNCGVREDINSTKIGVPNVFNVECKNNMLHIS